MTVTATRSRAASKSGKDTKQQRATPAHYLLLVATITVLAILVVPILGDCNVVLT